MNRLVYRISLCSFLFLAVLLFGLVARVHPALSHPINNGYSTLTLGISTVDYELFIPERSLLFFDTDHDKQLDLGELNGRKAEVEDYLRKKIVLSQNGEPLSMKLLTIDKSEKETIPGIVFQLKYTFSKEISDLTLKYDLLFDDADPNHWNFVLWIDGQDMDQSVMSASSRTYHFQRMHPPGMLDSLWTYFMLGIKHIITGYDHILFLLSLIVAAVRFMDVIKIVTAFTISHSVTLILAASGVINPPASWVEAVIALSICYVAAENLFFKRTAKRLLLTFGFGLVHGMGFAGALGEIGLPQQYFISSLLSFNLGVEAGQMGIVFVVLPMLLQLRKYSWYRYILLGASSAIFAVAFYWLLERIGWLPMRLS